MFGKRRSTNTPNYNQRQHLPAALPPPLPSVPSVAPCVPLSEAGSESPGEAVGQRVSAVFEAAGVRGTRQ